MNKAFYHLVEIYPDLARDAKKSAFHSLKIINERRDRMDWLKGINEVTRHIEENLTQSISYEVLARIVGCSVYEFSRIFSFMAGMSVSEYIRRRRLSQAVFDIQNGGGKIIDIALKYRYESPATFTRAFKELHGVTPSSARKAGVSLKTCPPITFVLTIKGVNEMDFRIEKKDSFQIIGYACAKGDGPDWDYFMDNYNNRLRNGDTGPCDGPNSYYQNPFWQLGAYKFKPTEGENGCIIGAELAEKPILAGMDVETIPAATWVVFSITSKVGTKESEETFARIYTDWFPSSPYKRDEKAPTMEVYPAGNANLDDYHWEVWVPVQNK